MSFHHLLGQYLLRRGGTGVPAYQSAVQGLGNLIAYYPLNENAGTTIVCPNNSGLNGTYNGGVALANLAGPGASMGNAPLFDGTTGFGQLPAVALNSVFDPTKGTISIWINTNGSWPTTEYFYSIGVDTNNFVVGGKETASTVIIYDKKGGSISSITVSLAVTAGWHNIIETWDQAGNALKLYIDGGAPSSHTLAGAWTGSLTNALCTLARLNGGTYWKGWLAGFSLFSDVKSGAAITTLSTPL